MPPNSRAAGVDGQTLRGPAFRRFARRAPFRRPRAPAGAGDNELGSRQGRELRLGGATQQSLMVVDSMTPAPPLPALTTTDLRRA